MVPFCCFILHLNVLPWPEYVRPQAYPSRSGCDAGMDLWVVDFVDTIICLWRSENTVKESRSSRQFSQWGEGTQETTMVALGASIGVRGRVCAMRLHCFVQRSFFWPDVACVLHYYRCQYLK